MRRHFFLLATAPLLVLAAARCGLDEGGPGGPDAQMLDATVDASDDTTMFDAPGTDQGTDSQGDAQGDSSMMMMDGGADAPADAIDDGATMDAPADSSSDSGIIIKDGGLPLWG